MTTMTTTKLATMLCAGMLALGGIAMADPAPAAPAPKQDEPAPIDPLKPTVKPAAAAPQRCTDVAPEKLGRMDVELTGTKSCPMSRN
jgi:hypothetical protein